MLSDAMLQSSARADAFAMVAAIEARSADRLPASKRECNDFTRFLTVLQGAESGDALTGFELLELKHSFDDLTPGLRMALEDRVAPLMNSITVGLDLEPQIESDFDGDKVVVTSEEGRIDEATFSPDGQAAVAREARGTALESAELFDAFRGYLIQDRFFDAMGLLNEESAAFGDLRARARFEGFAALLDRAPVGTFLYFVLEHVRQEEPFLPFGPVRDIGTRLLEEGFPEQIIAMCQLYPSFCARSDLLATLAAAKLALSQPQEAIEILSRTNEAEVSALRIEAHMKAKRYEDALNTAAVHAPPETARQLAWLSDQLEDLAKTDSKFGRVSGLLVDEEGDTGFIDEISVIVAKDQLAKARAIRESLAELLQNE